MNNIATHTTQYTYIKSCVCFILTIGLQKKRMWNLYYLNNTVVVITHNHNIHNELENI